MKQFLRRLLRAAGKGNQKVIAVFGVNRQACDRAVRYVCAGEGTLPVWLFCTFEPFPETARLCQRTIVCGSSLVCLLEAERILWRQTVALGVATWTGDKGGWPLTLAPYLIPPFRALFLNQSGDFLEGYSIAVLTDASRRARARFYGILELLMYHVWRSGPFTRVKDVTCATFVRTAALLLKTVGNPHRRWLHRVHGEQNLQVRLAGTRGGGVARFGVAGRDWRGTELEAELRSSDARFMIWQENSGEPVDELLPLFADERTFAVSVQCHYRGWSPSLLDMAPFRPLDPGEAALVFAPVSSTIVVDRQKLMALGIPRRGLSTTAWLHLFWKAAAAGWRSYSIGRNGVPNAQPDFPEPEAAFFLRLVSKRQLRQLGPKDPDLMRGNVAFSLSLMRQVDSRRLRVLIVSPFLPFPLSHGGAVRIWNLCRALLDRVDFFLIAIREREDRVDYAKLGEVFREVHVVDLDEPPSPDETLPLQVRHHQSRSLTALIRDLSARLRPDLIQIEFTHMAHFREAMPEVPSILVEHDLTFTLYRQLMENGPSVPACREYERWHTYERRYLRTFDAVWTMSDDDRRLAIREGSRPDRTFTIPNGVDTERFTMRNEAGDRQEILYVGSFRHLPNVLGFEMLSREVMPQVWSRYPGVQLRVVAGPRHEFFWRRFCAKTQALPADERIEINGFVSDLRPLYASSSVVAVPLEVSAGTNLKVLEAMACGKAIVTTVAGCRGLGITDGREALICDSDKFAAAVCRVLESEELRDRLGSRARQTAEELFRWEAMADRAYESYMAVCASRTCTGIQSRAS